MSTIRHLDKSIVENQDFANQTQDITIRVELGGGETLQFTAEKEFFSPRRVATNMPDVIKMDNVVEYTPNNTPVVKMSNIQKQLTKPQFYLNSIVQDVYKPYPVDTFFTELTDDLAVPAYTGTQDEQRQMAISNMLELEKQAVAAYASDPEAYDAAVDAIDDNYSSQAGLTSEEPLTPAETVTPEEEDQLAILDFVGLGEEQSIDTSADVISPLPTVNESDVITFGEDFPKMAGKIKGTETINKAIDLLNQGITQVEETTKTGVTDDGKCKNIVVAPGKKGKKVLGMKVTKAKSEKVVSRSETQTKLNKVLADIAAQESSPTTIIDTTSGVPMLVKIQKAGIFGKLVKTISKVAGAVPLIGSSISRSINGVVPKGMKPMSKDQALEVLRKTQTELEGILAKDC